MFYRSFVGKQTRVDLLTDILGQAEDPLGSDLNMLELVAWHRVYDTEKKKGMDAGKIQSTFSSVQCFITALQPRKISHKSYGICVYSRGVTAVFF